MLWTASGLMPLPVSPPSASPLSLSRIRENWGRLVLVIKMKAREKSRASFINQMSAGQTKLNPVERCRQGGKPRRFDLSLLRKTEILKGQWRRENHSFGGNCSREKSAGWLVWPSYWEWPPGESCRV